MITTKVTSDAQRIIDMTKGELQELIKGLICNKEEEKVACYNDYHDIPRLVTGIKDAARVLGVSPSTIARWKKSGEYDGCIFQDGKIVRFDTHKMLEKMRTSNWKGKYVKAMSNQAIDKLWKRK